MAKHFHLIGGTLIAGDSTRLRAQNSKKNNFNEKKIERHLAYIDKKLEEYYQALSEADNDQQSEQIQEKIDQQNQRKAGYEQLQTQLKATGQEQISTSDPESRQLMIRNNISEVAYNVQTTVDAQHCLPIDYQVTNQNDSKAMGAMVRRAKSIVSNNTFTALYDKGYHTGSELAIAQGLGVTTLVAIPAPASKAPDAAYNAEEFAYDAAKDHYICPQGEILTSTGNFYIKKHGRVNQTLFQQYRTKACKTCPVKSSCTSSKRGKTIERNEYASCYEQNQKNVEANPTLYKRRQAIVEHPFGTIKRQWGYSYILTKKGMQRASSDVGFIFIAYNLRRIINLIGFKALMAYAMTCPVFIALLCAVNQILKAFIDVWEDVSYRAGKSSCFLNSSLFLKHNQLISGSF